MIYIEKSSGPNSLMVAKKSGIHRYDELHADVKKSIKEALYAEQKGLCAYCMRRLKIDTMQIEHYIPQHDEQGNYNAALSIDFHNMLGVCPGGKDYDADKYEELICDQHRRNEKLTVDPRIRSSVKKIKYSRYGFMFSDDEDISYDLNVILNLNCKKAGLAANRLATLEQFQELLCRNYSGKQLTKETWTKFLHKYLDGNSQGIRIEYVGVIIKYIEDKLGI